MPFWGLARVPRHRHEIVGDADITWVIVREILGTLESIVELGRNAIYS